MSAEVVIVCPELARGSGGLADHTLRVVAEWRDQTRFRFIVPATRDSQGPPLTEPNVEIVERNRDALREKLPAGAKVFLQYSAYGFDHFGYPRWLLQALVDWKASAGGLFVVMFHEIWTFWPVLNKNYLIQQLHRRDLRTLLARADAVFTSTPNQAEHLCELSPAVDVQVLPVGSNIIPREKILIAREPGFAVLFGLQGSRLRALRSMRSDLEALASAGHLTRLVTVGGGNTAEGDREEDEILRALSLATESERLGSLPEDEISAVLHRASFGVSAQDELSLMKSGTFMAYAAHGLNILSSLGDRAKEEPICWLTQPTELLRGLSPGEQRSRAEHLRVWQERSSSWSAIAGRLATALQINQAVERAES